MKIYTFDIDKYQAEWIFKPIRTKKDVLVILLRVIKVMLIPNHLGSERGVGKIILHVEKMSRLFFISESKIFTINFPFFVHVADGGVSFKTHACPEIDNKVTSEILGLLDSDNVFESNEFVQFVDPVDDACVLNSRLWPILRDLLVYEDGYMRYDVDPVHQNGHLHPVHHIDVFYTSSATFKIGLRQPIDQEYLANILRQATDCYYLGPAV